MARIYALMAGQLVLYVGQTKRDLSKREYGHRHYSNATTSKHIPDYVDWTIQLLEECDDVQSTAREQYYYDILKPLYNRCRPGQPEKESRRMSYMKEERKQYLLDRNREYQKTDAYKEYQRQYRLKKKAERITPV